VERAGADTFVWTAARAIVVLPDLDRRDGWSCRARVRGARPAGLPQPAVSVSVDARAGTVVTATNDYQDVGVEVPAQGGADVTLAITSIPTFVPGTGDRRELGVQVDRIACHPADRSFALPPRGAMTTAAMTGAAFAAMLAAMRLTSWLALTGAIVVAAGLAVPLSTGPAVYLRDYLDRVLRAGLVIPAAAVLLVIGLERWRRGRLSVAARLVVAVSAGMLLLKLVALLHPVKPLVDALFHAHRLEWVLDGRYYFTQPMPDGVRFPYAIGLYVFASPWAVLTRDHVALLRIVVSASEAVAIGLMYPTIAGAWGARGTAVAAVALLHAAPLPYVVIGNANLTFAFSQAAALAAMTVAVAWAPRIGTVPAAAGLWALAGLAFLSHVGTFPLLFVALVALAVLMAVFGGSALRAHAVAVALAAVLAATLSVAVYYAHFPEVYESLGRVQARTTGSVTPPAASSGETGEEEAQGTTSTVPRSTRALRALELAVGSAGWPLVALAALGAWRLAATRTRDRLTLAVSAWLLSWIGFVLASVLAPVDPRFQRYTDEFIDRVNYATLPAVAMLGAYGSSWAWRSGTLTRAISAVLLVAAAIGAFARWVTWLD
jgi:hypothetical protein